MGVDPPLPKKYFFKCLTKSEKKTLGIHLTRVRPPGLMELVPIGYIWVKTHIKIGPR
jgi:hypothetical protein